ncbi:MAG: SHOCT domain-containing protein, partial [Patescibacteria group bacterium]|nr:SHOCT domain-containing protein [Patescibacteria group bacterium]
AIWEKLQAKELICENLSDDNFGSLGEYFMGQMAGKQHETMNNMMIQMMDEKGEKQMHVAMGKRISDCQPNALLPQSMMGGMMNTMTMMEMGNFGNNLMGGFGFGWIFMILFWGLVIAGIVMLIKWIVNTGKHEVKSKSALDILKERYAKGEIDQKEFEEKKKDLS